MDLVRHARVLWRFRCVVLCSVSLGLVLAVLAAYSVSWNDGPTFTPRGSERWSANSSILVTQPGFPEGRVTLPERQVGDAVTSAGQRASRRRARPSDQVEFADPARLAGLADLYSRFLTSDEVLSRVPQKIAPSDVLASPFASSQGGLVLPVIQLTTNARSRREARDRNFAVFIALRTVLAERQTLNRIPRGRRVELKVIDTPKAALISGRKYTASILALALCVLGGVAVAHLLAALRGAADEAALAPVIAWADERAQPDGDRPERVSRRVQLTRDEEPVPPPVAHDRR